MRGREDGRPFGRSFSKLVRPCGRPSGGLASLRGRCRPMRPAGSVEARTWGLITQPHTVMRPIRHRRPSLIPGAHQVSRKGDGEIMGEMEKGVDKGGVKFLREVNGIKGLGEMRARICPPLSPISQEQHPPLACRPSPPQVGRSAASSYSLLCNFSTG